MSAAEKDPALQPPPSRASGLKRILIIIPCLNEEKYITDCLTSVLAFEVPAGTSVRILVLDGRSADRTVEIVQTFIRKHHNIDLVDNPGRIQSCALNRGILAADSDVVVRLDAHAKYPVDYLVLCFETLTRTGADNVGGIVVTHAGAEGLQGTLVQALTTHKFGVGNSGFRTGAQEGPSDTVPYGCFRRELFDRVGLFDERLVRAQDYEFNRRIKESGGRVWLNPNIVVHYFNQPTIGGFLRKQLIHEAPYNAYMWYLAPYSFALRHCITGLFAAGFCSGLVMSCFWGWARYTFGGVMVLYALIAIFSGIQQALRYRSVMLAVMMPACFFLFHFCHGIGLLNGLLKLVIGRAPVQLSSEPWSGAGRFRAWPNPGRG